MVSLIVLLLYLILHNTVFMSRKGPKVGQGMLDFVEDYHLGFKSH